MTSESNAKSEPATEPPRYPIAKTYALGGYITFMFVFFQPGLLLAIPFLWINPIEIGSGKRLRPMGVNGKMVLSLTFLVVGVYPLFKMLLQ